MKSPLCLCDAASRLKYYSSKIAQNGDSGVNRASFLRASWWIILAFEDLQNINQSCGKSLELRSGTKDSFISGVANVCGHYHYIDVYNVEQLENGMTCVDLQLDFLFTPSLSP